MPTTTTTTDAPATFEVGDTVRLDVGVGSKTQQRQTWKVTAVNPGGTYTIAPVGGGRPLRAKPDQIVKCDANGTAATLVDADTPAFIAPGTVVVITRPDRFRSYTEGTPLVVTSDRSGGLTVYLLDGSGRHWTGVAYAAVRVVPVTEIAAAVAAAFPPA